MAGVGKDMVPETHPAKIVLDRDSSLLCLRFASSHPNSTRCVRDGGPFVVGRGRR
jgi:hypothetical protein